MATLNTIYVKCLLVTFVSYDATTYLQYSLLLLQLSLAVGESSRVGLKPAKSCLKLGIVVPVRICGIALAYFAIQEGSEGDPPQVRKQ